MKIAKSRKVVMHIIVKFDNDLSVIKYDSVICNYLKVSKEDFEKPGNKNITKYLSKTWCEKVKLSANNAFQSGKKQYEYIWRNRLSEHLQVFKAKVKFVTIDKELALDANIYDISKDAKKFEKYISSSDLYDYVLTQTHNYLWEYNIIDKTLKSNDEVAYSFNAKNVILNVPDSLIEQKFVHPDDISIFEQLFNFYNKGDSKITRDFRYHLVAGEPYKWLRVTQNVLYDLQKKPIRLACLGRDITERKNEEIKLRQKEQLQQIVGNDILGACRLNLTQKKFEYFDSVLRMEKKGTEIMSLGINEVQHFIVSNIANSEDEVRFKKLFSFEALLESYHNGKRNVAIEYKRKTPDGRIKWAELVIKLVEEPISNDVYGYAYLRDIDIQKSLELSLLQNPERDKTTDLFSRNTTMALLQKAVHFCVENNTQFVMFLCDIDNYLKILLEYGPDAGHAVLFELASLLETKAGRGTLVGHYGEDRFLGICMRNDEISDVFNAIELIRQRFGSPYFFPQIENKISFSAGVILGGPDNSDFQSLIEQCESAVIKAKAKGGARIERFVDNEYSVNLEQLRKQELNIKMDEKDIIIRTAIALQDSRNLKTAIEDILREISLYYQSRGALLFEIDVKNSAILKFFMSGYSFEDNDSKMEFQKDITYLVKNNIVKAISKEKYILIDDIETLKKRYVKEYELLLKMKFFSFIVTPLVIDGEIRGCIVIDNPTKNKDKNLVLETLQKFIAKTINQFNLVDRQNFLLHYDQMTGLKNRLSYNEYFSSFNPDAVTSLGIFYVSINGLKNINIEFGHEYGDSIIQYISSSISLVFGGDSIYRTSGDEFLVICVNCIQDMFINKIEILKRNVRNRYEDLISTGYAWACEEINPLTLYMSANEKMFTNKQEYYRKGTSNLKMVTPEMKRELLSAIASNMYEVFLQPKAEISTGKIFGAEALIRMHQQNSGYIGPDKFVPQLERTGLISYIDLFVFEFVCKKILEWKDEYRNVIVSLNFSRATLLSEEIFDRIEETLQKYPIEKSFIEIEITESLGDYERDSITRIGQKLVDYGFNLSLDDFGARFSNVSILSNMDFHTLKFDKSLVHDIASNKKSRQIIKNFITTCKELNIKTIAEGVETEEQYKILGDMFCDYVQGYYINKPLICGEFERVYLKAL